jgi:hypothetical protein
MAEHRLPVGAQLRDLLGRADDLERRDRYALEGALALQDRDNEDPILMQVRPPIQIYDVI